jgi:DNA-binding FadR family transcriptional regulator
MRDVLVFESIRSKSKLSQIVLENLKTALIDGKLKPGDKLPSISELASQMNVGISSVREAVKMLECLEILEIRQGDGTFVSSMLSESAFNALSLQLLLVPRSVKDLVEFRSLFETAFTHLAMQNAAPEDFEELDGIVAAQELKAETEPLGEQEEWEFHSRVLACTHNPYMIRVGRSMLEIFISTIPQCAEVVTKYSIAKDHRNLVNYMKAKNVAGVDKILKKSFDGWEQRLVGQPFFEPEGE